MAGVCKQVQATCTRSMLPLIDSFWCYRKKETPINLSYTGFWLNLNANKWPWWDCLTVIPQSSALKKKSSGKSSQASLKILSNSLFNLWPRWDSNPHALASTSPSSWQVYRFSTWPKIKKVEQNCSTFSDPTGARTQDPIIKSDVLYQLSYRVNIIAKRKKMWPDWGSNPGPHH